MRSSIALVSADAQLLRVGKVVGIHKFGGLLLLGVGVLVGIEKVGFLLSVLLLFMMDTLYGFDGLLVMLALASVSLAVPIHVQSRHGFDS